jgi:hypothetical protein
MVFSLSLSDAGLVIAVSAAILLVTSEVISLYYSRIQFMVDLRKLRNAGIALALAFLCIAVIKVTAGLHL